LKSSFVLSLTPTRQYFLAQVLSSAHLPFLAKAFRLTLLLALALRLAPDAAAADLLDDSTDDASIDSS
jgi:hypothetical protein